MLTDDKVEEFNEWISKCPLECILLYEELDGIIYKFIVPTQLPEFSDSFFND
jgi:hypothetical protein